MAISVGDKLPDATLLRMGDSGPESIKVGDLVTGRKVVIFAVPGAFTPTCHSAHVPSFIRVKDKLAEKGVDEIVCISVNDPFIMKIWGEQTGANDAGITMLSDGNAELTRAIGMNFSAEPVGFVDRSRRYAMLVEDGTVTRLHKEESPGTCEISGGEAMLAAV